MLQPRGLALILVAALAFPAAAQEDPGAPPASPTPPAAESESDEEPAPSGPRPIRAEDYGRFERLGATVLSPDGRWLAYTISRVDEEYELRLRMLATEDTQVIEYGTNPVFSADGDWLVYGIGPSPKEREAARKKGESTSSKAALRSLVTGETVEIEGISRWSFSEDGRYLALLREGKGAGGRDLLVRDMTSGIATTFGHVASFAWCEAQCLLAMVLDTAENIGNSVQLWDPSRSTLRTLDAADADYTALHWREDSCDLAVLREIDHEDDEDVSHVVLSWRGLGGEGVAAEHLDPRDFEGFPDLRLVHFAGLRWTKDGSGLTFGLKEWENKPADYDAEDDAEDEESEDSEGDSDAESESETGSEEDGAEETEADGESLRESLEEMSDVEVWHAQDVDIMPLQKRRSGQVEREHWLAVWWLDQDRMVQLGDELCEDVTPMPRGSWALGLDHTPYERERMFGPTLHDLYRIDMTTGEKQRFLSANKYRYTTDPSGQRVIYVKDDQIWSYELDADTHRRLAADVDVALINQEMSSLTDEKPPYGVSGFSADGATLYLYDRYDLWSVPVDGSEPARRTKGRGAEHRVPHVAARS